MWVLADPSSLSPIDTLSFYEPVIVYEKAWNIEYSTCYCVEIARLIVVIIDSLHGFRGSHLFIIEYRVLELSWSNLQRIVMLTNLSDWSNCKSETTRNISSMVFIITRNEIHYSIRKRKFKVSIYSLSSGNYEEYQSSLSQDFMGINEIIKSLYSVTLWYSKLFLNMIECKIYLITWKVRRRISRTHLVL